jgi:molecular chaperone DnaK
MKPAFAIDFGTQNCLAAYLDQEGFPEIISLTPTNAALSSRVARSEDGSWIFGAEAKKKELENPAVTIDCSKRFFKGSPKASEKNPFLNWNPEKSAFQIGEEHLAAELSAEIVLKKVMSLSQAKFKEPLESAVLSIPVLFDQNQLQALQKAAQAAGLKKISFIKDCAATALAYYFLKKKRGKFFIYHLGAGYFEAAVVAMEEGKIQVLASSGNDFGGRDIDEIVTQNLLRELETEYGSEVTKDAVFRQRILDEVEKAKCAVSHRGSYDFKIIDEKKGVRFVRAYSRFELEQEIGEPFEVQYQICEKLLQEAKLPADYMDDIFLSGSASRLPMVEKIIMKLFKKKPKTEINPDQAIVMGAALKAGIEQGNLKIDLIEKTKVMSPR